MANSSNAIIYDIQTDPAGKSTIIPINLTGKKPLVYSMYGEYNQTIFNQSVNFFIQGNLNGSSNYNRINDVMNKILTNTYSIRTGVSSYKQNYNFVLSLTPEYFRSHSSLQPDFNDNGWGLTNGGSLTFSLPKQKISFNTQLNYKFRARTKSFDNNLSRFLADVTLNKKFLKSQSLVLSGTINDIFNNNIGFSRNATSNYLTQSEFLTIKRYALISLAWDFNKMNGK